MQLFLSSVNPLLIMRSRSLYRQSSRVILYVDTMNYPMSLRSCVGDLQLRAPFAVFISPLFVIINVEILRYGHPEFQGNLITFSNYPTTTSLLPFTSISVEI